MMIIRWMSAKARRRLKTLADGSIEERVLQCFPIARVAAPRGPERRPAPDIDRGEIIFEGKPEQALEDASVMKALRG